MTQQKDLFTRRWRSQMQPQKEATFHIQLVSMLRWCVRPDIIWRHVPNGEHRDKRTARKLKAMGILPGSADLEFHWCEMLLLPRYPQIKCRRVLHLELKAGNRRQSDSQAEFELAVRLLGDHYHVARSVDEALNVLDQFGLLRHDRQVRRYPLSGL